MDVDTLQEGRVKRMKLTKQIPQMTLFKRIINSISTITIFPDFFDNNMKQQFNKIKATLEKSSKMTEQEKLQEDWNRLLGDWNKVSEDFTNAFTKTIHEQNKKEENHTL